MVTGEWKKDGGKWFYLDDDGDMLTDSWVDDDYYVGEDGAMLTNAWKYTMADDDQDDPDEDGGGTTSTTKVRKLTAIQRRSTAKLLLQRRWCDAVRLAGDLDGERLLLR